MNQPAIKHRPLMKLSTWPWQPYVLAGAAIAIIIGILFSLDSALSIHRFAVIGTFLSIGVFSATLKLAEASRRKQLLEQLARQTKFICQAGTPLLGYPMRLVGTYGNRAIIFFYSLSGRSYASTTKVVAALDNFSDASLRLRGPYQPSILGDKVTVDMFSAAQMRPVGNDKIFFVGGSPIHITTNLLAGETLRQSLESLPPGTNIELTQQRLMLSYPSQIDKVEQITHISALVSDLADAIEQKSGARHKMLWRQR